MTTLDKVIEVLSDISLIDEIRPEMTMDDLGLGMYERDVVKCILAVQNIHALTTVNDIVNLIESKGYETL
jgi:hypothetical protein